jgi:2-amino-4-hydroxy-6-hydroxymethyldihydropteridine diphosphokinase
MNLNEEVFLLTGSNLGDRFGILEFAREHFSKGNCRLLETSAIYESEAWGFESNTPFLNQALKISTDLEPETLMRFILETEKEAGRIRNFQGYEDRLLDIDILFYGSRVIKSEFLQIPHPRIEERRFVLEPLSDIASDFIHPVSGKSISRLLSECEDQLKVKKIMING